MPKSKVIPLESSFQEQSFETLTKSGGYTNKKLWPENKKGSKWTHPPLIIGGGTWGTVVPPDFSTYGFAPAPRFHCYSL